MEYSKDNTMTRKEYLKSKKKHRFDFSKLKYILLIIVVILLVIYVFKQLKVYNNVTQIANKVVEETKLTRTMTMYYVSDSYTKDGKKSVILYKYSDESRTKITGTEDFSKISIVDNKLYGIVEKLLYSIDLTSLVKEQVTDKKMEDYVVKGDNVYIKASDGIFVYNISSKVLKQLVKGKTYQMVIDDEGVFVIAEGKTSKSIIKYNLNGGNKKQLSDKYIVSSMYIKDGNIYFINSKDSKLYSMTNSGENIKKLTNNKVKKYMLKHKDVIYYINNTDGNTLYSIDLKTGKEQRVVKKNIESI